MILRPRLRYSFQHLLLREVPVVEREKFTRTVGHALFLLCIQVIGSKVLKTCLWALLQYLAFSCLVVLELQDSRCEVFFPLNFEWHPSIEPEDKWVKAGLIHFIIKLFKVYSNIRNHKFNSFGTAISTRGWQTVDDMFDTLWHSADCDAMLTLVDKSHDVPYGTLPGVYLFFSSCLLPDPFTILWIPSVLYLLILHEHELLWLRDEVFESTSCSWFRLLYLGQLWFVTLLGRTINGRHHCLLDVLNWLHCL